MKIFNSVISISIFILFLQVQGYGFNILGDCLVTEDIGKYNFRVKSARMGNGPGVVGITGHLRDHVDVICTGSYSNIDEIKGLPIDGAREKIISIAAEVTQHGGSDSDKWLLHEVERGFRRGKFEENMTPARFRSIDGNSIFYSGLGGGTYRWLSNYIVVSIEYVDLYKQKSEPMEVVKAYLTKFPSTISPMVIDRVHNEQWIKGEMERRLWLCGKWFLQLQMGKVELDPTLREVVDHMETFLDYREKYYGVKAKDEKIILMRSLDAKDGTAIKNKLAEYKKWWVANKGKIKQIAIGK